MSKFFISIYRYFLRHRLVFWASMLLSFAVAAFFATRLDIEENITAFSRRMAIRQ